MKDRIYMKELFYIALSLALLTNCMPTGSAKLEDVQISVKDSLWIVQPAYDSLGNSIKALGRI